LCYGHSTYLPLRHTGEIQFYRLTEAPRVNAHFPQASAERIIQRPKHHVLHSSTERHFSDWSVS
jgi:hypothetical protein